MISLHARAGGCGWIVNSTHFRTKISKPRQPVSRAFATYASTRQSESLLDDQSGVDWILPAERHAFWIKLSLAAANYLKLFVAGTYRAIMPIGSP
jgi:hypothetical protein